MTPAATSAIPLLLIKNIEYHPFMMDYIYEFQRGFLEAFPDARVTPARFIKVKRQVLRGFRLLQRHLPTMPHVSLKFPRRREASFAVLCGGDFAYCLPRAFITERNYLYIFDAWPQTMWLLAKWARLFLIDKIFFSALQSTELFNQIMGEEKGVWIPEGIHPLAYKFLPYNQKTLDVVEFGRRYDVYHDQIAPALAKASLKHYYDRGRINKPLSQAKVSICFPSSITHPQRSGYISTMTLRYLQSMLSKCLIVGSLPFDMQHIFDYNPVIEADLQDPAGQLLDILDNYTNYIPLIEQNYRVVMERHQWANRMESIKKHILVP